MVTKLSASKLTCVSLQTIFILPSKINPNIPEMNFNLGAILFSENKVEEAIKFYEKSIQLINALGALPQFSYEGILNGKKVIGYSANLLSKNNWMLFGQIFNEENLNKRKELRNNFYNLPVDHRLKMAYDNIKELNVVY